jgi:serine-type D-Ala-D-Ala carboxypeptidase/endopeptidase (penicillin-binding protein 4)
MNLHVPYSYVPGPLHLRARARLLALALMGCASPAYVFAAPRHTASSIDARVQVLLASPAAEKAHWGVLVTDASTGQVLYSLNGNKFFIPASTTKLFTTGFALAKLGPNFRFRTTLESSALPDAHGRLSGDLLLIGRGAPDLSNRHYPYDPHVNREGPAEKVLAEMVDALIARGVREVDGDVVADDSAFENKPYPVGWEIEDVKYGYGTPVSALSVNDNLLFVHILPGERTAIPARISVEPPMGEVYVTNAVTTNAKGGEAKLSMGWRPGSGTVEIAGSVPLDGREQDFAIANPHPAEYAARLLKFLLEQRGIVVSGHARMVEAPSMNPSAGRQVLAEHFSPPLREVVAMTNKNSENLYAELLLRAVDLSIGGTGSLAGGWQAERNFLQVAGVPVDEVSLEDGSGLSRGNLVTPEAVVALLRYAAAQSWGADYLASLPVVGEDGTLALQLKGTAAAGRVQAKTGTLEHTKAMAGYATTLSGRRVIFALFGGNYTMSGAEAAAILDGICLVMVEDTPATSGKRCRKCPK